MSHMRHVPQQYQQLVEELTPGLDCGYHVYGKLRDAYSELCLAAYDYDAGVGSAGAIQMAQIRLRNVCLIHNLGDEGVL